MTEPLRHTIQAVSRKTGLSQDVLRVWEKRYQAVQPGRSSTNRRLYSDQDLERLRMLAQATRAGYNIGHAARMSLQELVEACQDTPGQQLVAPFSRDHLASVLSAARSLDPPRLCLALAQAAADLTQPRLLSEVVHPLLQRIGEGWRQGDLSVASEHLATASVRSLLGHLSEVQDLPDHAPVLVCTTPSGQRHELGALMVALSATSEGWKACYLGPDMPAQEIFGAARQTTARGVALSLVYPPDDPGLPDEVLRLRGLLAPQVEIFVGGRASQAYWPRLRGPGISFLENLQDFRDHLQTLRS